MAQSGSALVLGTRGRWFKSSYPDHLKIDFKDLKSIFFYQFRLLFFPILGIVSYE